MVPRLVLRRIVLAALFALLSTVALAQMCEMWSKTECNQQPGCEFCDTVDWCLPAGVCPPCFELDPTQCDSSPACKWC